MPVVTIASFIQIAPFQLAHHAERIMYVLSSSNDTSNAADSLQQKRASDLATLAARIRAQQRMHGQGHHRDGGDDGDDDGGGGSGDGAFGDTFGRVKVQALSQEDQVWLCSRVVIASVCGCVLHVCCC